MKDIYSPYKIAHHESELRLFRNGQDLLVVPTQIQIDPFNPCNHDCPFCVYRYHKDSDINALFNESDVIPYRKMVEILDSCVSMGIKAIESTGGGESTLHPRILDFFQAALERDLEIGLVTNGCGTNWKANTKTMTELLAHAQWVRFSLDAATPETHRKIHRSKTDDFQLVRQNIQKLVEAKNGQQSCVVGVSFIVTHDNYHEIIPATELVKSLGADNIRFSAAVFEGLPDGYHTPHHQVVIEALDHVKETYTDDNFAVFTFGERMDFRNAFGDYEPGDRCFYSHLNAVIGADLNLYPCCVLKYRPAGLVASLKHQTFEDAWHSYERREYYRKLDIASQCKTCYLKPKNDFIKYLVQPDPPHVNFI